MSSAKMVKGGVVGGAGFTGGELIRLLLFHPNVNISFIQSSSNANKALYEVHKDLLGDTEIKFSGELDNDIDVLFLCKGHGEAEKFLQENTIPSSVKIIDLSRDFRWKKNSDFIYGLPEVQRGKIKSAKYIANPGCFATATQLALLPLAANGLLTEDIHVSATTGSTGAGQSLTATNSYNWRNNNLSVYSAFDHPHLYEIGKTLSHLQNNLKSLIHFIPQRGSFTRGILANVYTKSTLPIDEINKLYKEYYKTHPFTLVSNSNIDVKQVVNTNKCFLYLQKHGDTLLVTSIIDNMLKGAVGQAVQNMNLMFGLEETTGLKLKSIAF